MTARDTLGVVIGAVAGAAARWGLGELFGLRLGLLVANVAGCAIVGWSVRRSRDIWWSAGLAGALTSFSALALQFATDLDAGRYADPVWWLLLTAVGCAASWKTFGPRHRSAA